MKYIKTVLLPFFFFSVLLGCAQTKGPEDGTAESWQAFGLAEATKGYMKKSPDDFESISSDLYKAYTVGYEEGRQEYCQQDAYKLGIMGKPYTGICDDLDWKFRMRFNDGRVNQSMGRL